MPINGTGESLQATELKDDIIEMGGVSSMKELQICMLGDFQLCWDYRPISESFWPHPMAKSLLKMVLISRPNSLSASEAVRRLGNGMEAGEISSLVKLVDSMLQPAASILLSSGDLIQFNKGPRCWIDYDALIAHYKQGIDSASRGEIFPAILALQEADALYQGDLLEEVNDFWVEQPRRELRQIYIDTLDRLTEGYSVLARYHDAIGYCHKSLSQDPLREATYQRMMVYYYYMGNLVGVEESFRACTGALADVGRQVDPVTVELWERLSRYQMPTSPLAQAATSLQAPAPDPRLRRTPLRK